MTKPPETPETKLTENDYEQRLDEALTTASFIVQRANQLAEAAGQSLRYALVGHEPEPKVAAPDSRIVIPGGPIS